MHFVQIVLFFDKMVWQGKPLTYKMLMTSEQNA